MEYSNAMIQQSRASVRRKLETFCRSVAHAAWLNVEMLLEKTRGKKSVVLHVGAATQLMHIEPVVRELIARRGSRKMRIFVLTSESEVAAVKATLVLSAPGIAVGVEAAARFLVFCDLMMSVDQGTIYPFLGCKIRACSFHGQPSKGNVYQRFNYRQINALFFYGPLMREHYLRAKMSHPNWPTIPCYEVGQPLSDRLFSDRQDKARARLRLGLEPRRFTVIYAPSFEYCSSFSLHGEEIIESLLNLDINLIVKPHPAFYNVGRFHDPFNQDAPNVADWSARVESFNGRENCVFSADNTLDAATAFSASDAMLTDYSGVAFDGILLDLGMIFWDCPLLFSEYLPKRYGIDAEEAKADLACNAGRDSGIIVKNTGELLEAVIVYRQDPSYKGEARMRIREQLLFNPGCATAAAADTIQDLLGMQDNDR